MTTFRRPRATNGSRRVKAEGEPLPGDPPTADNPRRPHGCIGIKRGGEGGEGCLKLAAPTGLLPLPFSFP